MLVIGCVLRDERLRALNAKDSRSVEENHRGQVPADSILPLWESLKAAGIEIASILLL